MSYKAKSNHPSFEFAFTDEDFYTNFAAFASVSATVLHGDTTYSPALDFAWGWHLNKNGQ